MLVKSYVWAKNNKTISLTFIKQGVRGTYLAWVTFESKDENLIK